MSVLSWAVPLEERFWSRVVKTDSCWLWQGCTKPNGYGRIKVGGGRSMAAHRLAYEWAYGPISTGLQLDHLCRNRACVNPAHLEPVTQAENVRRGANVALKTHCAQGHPWIAENIKTERSGIQRCIICARQRFRDWHARKSPCG